MLLPVPGSLAVVDPSVLSTGDVAANDVPFAGAGVQALHIRLSGTVRTTLA
ncbi:MAG TPA: hypothetical protein VGB85_28790 [Nannocystis sp.]